MTHRPSEERPHTPAEWQTPDYERSAEFAQAVLAKLRIIAVERGACSADQLLVLAAGDSQLQRLVRRGFAELAPELENEGVNVAELIPTEVFAAIVGTLVEIAMRDLRGGDEGAAFMPELQCADGMFPVR